MKKILPILFFLVWGFSIWTWIYFEQSQTRTQTLAKAELLAEVLAASNASAMQNQLEPFVSATSVSQEPDVMDAFVIDIEGHPITHQKNLDFGTNVVRIEKSIIGFQKEMLGKAVILYRLEIPYYISLWLLFYVPPVIAGASWFFCRRRLKKLAALNPPIEKEETYPWLSGVEKILAKKVYLLNARGNILAASTPSKARHLLDLFDDPSQAQEILKQLDQKTLENWREDDGEERFLLVHP